MNQEGQSTGGIALSPMAFWGVVIILLILVLSLSITSIIYFNRVRHFKFNDIFLIFKDGLLIAHAMREKRAGYDSDIIGSMFTAIQDFIQESFTDTIHPAKHSRLKRLDFGDFQIVINRGKYIYIAAVFSGFALRKMLLKIEKLRKQIEQKYEKVLKDWNGEMEELKGAQSMLEKLLYSTGPEPKAKPKQKEPEVTNVPKEPEEPKSKDD